MCTYMYYTHQCVQVHTCTCTQVHTCTHYILTCSHKTHPPPPPTAHRAYMKGHLDVLKLLQDSGVVDLCSDKLTLSGTNLPLFLDVLLNNSYDTLRIMMESKNPNDIFNHMYEYDTGTKKVKENALTILCKMLPQDELTASLSGPFSAPVPRPSLSLDLQALNITQVMLTNQGLRDVPLAIFGRQVKHLELQGNELTALPLVSKGGEPPPCPSLTFLNVSNNKLTTLPPAVFHLTGLNILYAGQNEIHDLPLDMWLAPKLETLSLTKNAIRGLPCPPSIPLELLGTSPASRVDPAGCGTHQTSLLRSLRQAHVSNEFDSSDDPDRFPLGCVLKTLDITDNQMTDVPRGLSCLVPILSTLKMAGNKLKSLGNIGTYPLMLTTLDASRNALVTGFSLGPHRYSCYQAKLRNTPPHCSHGDHTKLGQLRILNLSENKLENFSVLNDNVSPSEIIFPKLSSLKLSRNQLRQVPFDIHKMTNLSELAIDGNPEIQQLPLRIHLLEQLFSFKFEGIGDPIVRELSNIKTASEMRYYLKARETK